MASEWLNWHLRVTAKLTENVPFYNDAYIRGMIGSIWEYNNDAFKNSFSFGFTLDRDNFYIFIFVSTRPNYTLLIPP